MFLYMKNNLKMFFMYMIIMSTLFMISSSSWFNMWMWLEINLMMFISFMINKNKKLSIESSLIYFLIQSIASIMLLFSIIMLMMFNKFLNMMMFSILMKLGSAPFHYWMPLMIEGLNWINMFLLLTWQKINPLIMLFYNNNNNLLNMFIILSLITGAISSLNYSCLKKIMTFSSINQLSWIMMSLNFNKMMMLYLMFYFYLMMLIFMTFNNLNLLNINQIFNLNLKNNFYKIFIFTNMMSIGGLPPFLGFFPKLMILMKMNNLMIMFLMIMFSLIMLFMYLRIMMTMLLVNSLKMNLILIPKNKKYLKMMMMNSIMNNYLIMLLMFIY